MAKKGPSRTASNCSECGKFKQSATMKLDRHNKHHCVDCAIKVDFCNLCGSTKLDDDSMYGQLHYDDWCFK